MLKANIVSNEVSGNSAPGKIYAKAKTFIRCSKPVHASLSHESVLLNPLTELQFSGI